MKKIIVVLLIAVGVIGSLGLGSQSKLAGALPYIHGIIVNPQTEELAGALPYIHGIIVNQQTKELAGALPYIHSIRSLA